MISALLQKPYALNRSLAPRLKRAAATGLFVFLFLWFFEPFRLSTLPQGLLPITLGYGLITFAVMTTLALAMQLLPTSYYSEAQWTVGRELLWKLVNIGLIGMANLLYSAALGMVSVHPLSLIWFTGYALGVGVFPTAAVILANEARLSKAYAENSAAINRQLYASRPSPPTSGTVRIPAETKDGDMILDPADLYYIAASNNYAEVFFSEKGRMRKQLIRASLKTVERALAERPEFMRCHKGYVVNLSKVEEVTGNAQGHKLRLRDCEFPVPVSRSLNQILRERLTVRP